MINLFTKYGKYLKAIGISLFFAILGFILINRKRPNPPDLKNELRAIRAEADVRKLQNETSAQLARAYVETAYREHKALLTAEQQTEAQRLHSDPAALAAFLVRAGKKQ